MQEEVTQRTVALCVEATKLSAGMLQQAMKKALDEMQKGVTGHKTKLHHGRQQHHSHCGNADCGASADTVSLCRPAQPKELQTQRASQTPTDGVQPQLAISLTGRNISVIPCWANPSARTSRRSNAEPQRRTS